MRMTWPQNKDLFQFCFEGWVESINLSHHSLLRLQALASRCSVIVWVTFLTEMTCLIKGWPFATGMPQSLCPAVLACLSDLGSASWGFVWQIMANLAPASAPLVSPSSLISSWHSVLPSYMSSRPFQGAMMTLCMLISGWTFVSELAKMGSGWCWGRRRNGWENYSSVNHKLLMTKRQLGSAQPLFYTSLGVPQRSSMKYFTWRGRCSGFAVQQSSAHDGWTCLKH